LIQNATGMDKYPLSHLFIVIHHRTVTAPQFMRSQVVLISRGGEQTHARHTRVGTFVSGEALRCCKPVATPPHS
jgi:hypothetical protein